MFIHGVLLRSSSLRRRRNMQGVDAGMQGVDDRMQAAYDRMQAYMQPACVPSVAPALADYFPMGEITNACTTQNYSRAMGVQSMLSVAQDTQAENKNTKRGGIFTALHGMQTRISDENSICLTLSVCQTRVLWQNRRQICLDFNTAYHSLGCFKHTPVLV